MEGGGEGRVRLVGEKVVEGDHPRVPREHTRRILRVLRHRAPTERASAGGAAGGRERRAGAGTRSKILVRSPSATSGLRHTRAASEEAGADAEGASPLGTLCAPLSRVVRARVVVVRRAGEAAGAQHVLGVAVALACPRGWRGPNPLLRGAAAGWEAGGQGAAARPTAPTRRRTSRCPCTPACGTRGSTLIASPRRRTAPPSDQSSQTRRPCISVAASTGPCGPRSEVAASAEHRSPPPPQPISRKPRSGLLLPRCHGERLAPASHETSRHSSLPLPPQAEHQRALQRQFLLSSPPFGGPAFLTSPASCP